MVAPTLILQIGCFFGFLTCDSPAGVWPDDRPSVSPGSSGPVAVTVTVSQCPSTETGPPSLTDTTLTTLPSPTTGPTPTESGHLPDPEPTGPGHTSTEPEPGPTSTSTHSDGQSVTSQTSTRSTSTPVLPTHSSTSSTTDQPSTPVTHTMTSTSVVPSATGMLAADILVIAGDTASANIASSGLNGYGIPFTTLLVPQSGVELPALNSSSGGNFGGIVVVAEVSYDYGDVWKSALTTDQWNQLYAYQLAYGVRMVQYDVFPGPKYGAASEGEGCCAEGVEQLMYFSDVSDFATSGLRTGPDAGVGTSGLWHYPASVANSSSTKAVASFGGETETVAAVINDFEGRQQMVFFTGFATDWSAGSNYMQHGWITWMTRGLYAGYRRVNLNTQIDDMFLETGLYQPAGVNFRITTEDMDGFTSWLPEIRSRLNPGSTYFVEMGHNGNGNIEASLEKHNGYSICSGGAIEYDSPPATAQEFQKPLGTGTDFWPSSPTSFVWSDECLLADPLLVWFQEHVNDYAHISHTFTHLEQNNATFSDINKEISFNQVWLKRVGFSAAKWFTGNGLIPPAITGLHNGDALRAWSKNGITNCVGDNTRPALLNKHNEMWPYFTKVESDGFEGIQVNPRFATRIYYNCDTPACTVQEWIDTSAGAGDFDDLLKVEKEEVSRNLFGLHHDPYMFHQANLRNVGTDPVSINGRTAQWSIMQAWVETIVQEFTRLVTWPIVTRTHAEMSADFLARYKRDQCDYQLSYTLSDGAISGVTVSSADNSCGAPIPVTFPEAPVDTKGCKTEQLGNDPVTVWVELAGSPVSFSLASPIAL